jgi:hypothetical protein
LLISVSRYGDGIRHPRSLVQYEMLRGSTETLTTGLEVVFYNARHNFTLQYPLLLAPLIPGESDEGIRRKINIVGSYIDILITRRIWNGEVLILLENWRGASFADLIQQTGFGEPGRGAPHGHENTRFATHA